MPLLTQSSSFTHNGIRGHVVNHDGVPVRVYDDADTALRIIALFEDESIHEELKADILFGLLFPDPNKVLEVFSDDLTGLIEHCVMEVCGLDVSADRSPGKDIIDFETDAPYIRATIWNAYGASLDAIIHETTLPELLQLIALAPFETPMGQAIHYRTAKPPKATKYNADEIKDFNKRKRFWAIRKHGDVHAGDSGMTDAFNALRRACNG